MPFRLTIQIALRHLLRRKRQTFLATSGVMVGGAVFALVLSIAIGQRRFLRQKLIEVSPHVVLQSERLQPVIPNNLLGASGRVVELTTHTPPTARKEIKPYTKVMDEATKSSSLITAVAPFVSVNGVARNGTRSRAVVMRGIDPNRERYIAQLVQNIKEGKLDALSSNPNGAIIGRGLARKLAVGLGSDVSFIGPTGTMQIMHVVAVFQSGIAEIDDRRVYSNIDIAQAYRQSGENAVTGLSVQVSDIDRVGEVKEALEKATGYQALTWEESNKQILDFQSRQQNITRLIVVFVFITAAFGISNTMVAIVLQKKQDIAIMKSFGVSRAGIVWTFLLEGMIIGIIGGILAGLAGYGVASLFSTLNLFPQNNDRVLLRFDKFPIALDYWIYIMTAGIAFALSLIAGILPARRAAKFIPVQVIRGEV